MTTQENAETGIVPSCDENYASATDWNSVDWQRAMKEVRRLRQRIFRAERQGNVRKVRSLQKLMLRSFSNRLLAVRQVTQKNRGKFTPGVDGLVLKTPAARGKLVDFLALHEPWKASPVRRIYIPKANGKQRPLGIPTIQDRAMQAMVKNALEPQWEARFESRSYGFRPGRSAHDAIETIFRQVCGASRTPWVIDADIESAFDRISHEFLLRKLHRFPAYELIKQWLKAGVVENEVFSDSESGTPQGGVISPLLANIALDGMQEFVPNNRFVRYADDFLVFCRSRSEAEALLPLLGNWLSRRGLRLSESKTRIVHASDGFEFLGFHLQQVEASGTKRMTKNPMFRNPREGRKLLIRPSRDNERRLRDRVRDLVRQYQGAPQLALIDALNPVLIGWANYYRHCASSKVFARVDHFCWHRLWRWARRRHSNKGKRWTKARYWGRHHPERSDHWVFATVDPSRGKLRLLRKLSWVKKRPHIMVRGDASPDDPDLRSYWEKRRLKAVKEMDRPYHRTLAMIQKGLCPLCAADLENGEKLHIHHKVPLSQGGERHILNLQLVHLFCHQQIHANRKAGTA